jgi:hypothetical protein
MWFIEGRPILGLAVSAASIAGGMIGVAVAGIVVPAAYVPSRTTSTARLVERSFLRRLAKPKKIL